MTLVIAWLIGCGSDTGTAEAAIRAYNDAVIAAYRANDPAGMPAVATTDEVNKVIVLIDLKKNGHLVLESALESLEVTATSRPAAGKLDASTRERWSYYDRPIDPGTPAGTRYVVVMDLDYHLAEDGAGWKVASVEAKSSDYLEPAGFKLEAPPARTIDAGADSPAP